jgi:hypothetical protein
VARDYEAKEISMSKSTLVKWALTALLAAPAIPVLANSSYSGVRTLGATPVTHRKMASSSKRGHRYHTSKHRHSSLSKKNKHLSSRHSKHKSNLASTHTHHRGLSTSENAPIKVHPTHMPPTIDGIHA